MAARAEGWAALRDGLGPGWLAVAVAGVVGFWTVHEPGAAWTTMLSGRPAGFVAVVALATLWAADWVVRYALEADAMWLRSGLAYAWAVLLVLAVPVAVLRDLLGPAGAVALAAGHLWLSALAVMAGGLLWFHASAGLDAGRRFYLAVAATAAAASVWSVQAGVVAWPRDRSVLLVAWPVAFVLLLGLLVGARLAAPPTARTGWGDASGGVEVAGGEGEPAGPRDD